VVGRKVEEIGLPKGATIAALVRRNPVLDGRDSRRPADEVIIAHHDTVIQADDHVIVFAVNKRIVPKVEKLFQVGVGFL
jgi:trk system potassium uptake protein TrkA